MTTTPPHPGHQANRHPGHQANRHPGHQANRHPGHQAKRHPGHQADRHLAFLIGTGRCGSTLLHEMLSQHEDTGFISNLEDRVGLLARATAWNGSVFRALPVEASRKGRLRFAPSEAWLALDREVSPMLANSVRDLVAADATPWMRARMRAFFLSRADRQDAAVFTHKFTGWPRVGFLDACFDDPTFVHVVRDGRAVVNSWLQMPWWSGYGGPHQWQWGPLSEEQAEEWEASGRSFPILAAILWKMLMDAAEQTRSLVPSDRWLDVRYEDLLAEPDATLERVVAACGLSVTPNFRARVADYELRSGRREAWRDDLGPAADAVTASLADHLDRHGYR